MDYGTLISPSTSLNSNSSGKKIDKKMYMGMIGSVLYLTASQPDIMSNVCDKSDIKSTSRTCQILGDALILWHSKKQTSVAPLTTKAKYIAVKSCVKKIKINWATWIHEYMLGSASNVNASASLPYDMLITRILQYYSINLSAYPPIEVVSSYDSKMFASMGYVLVENEWCKKDSARARSELPKRLTSILETDKNMEKSIMDQLEHYAEKARFSKICLAFLVSGPSGRMSWIRNGPESLGAQNIIEAIDNRYLKTFATLTVNINSDVHNFKLSGDYVPMFGETDYDPLRHYMPVSFEEQLDALERAVDAGKISHDS
ncbi:hypothetical protein FXO37_09218 [Capsicum annuum]|nr:hypothetical protein FXO37_09218 [Capsicum annuum]